jgi:hypothetical protein
VHSSERHATLRVESTRGGLSEDGRVGDRLFHLIPMPDGRTVWAMQYSTASTLCTGRSCQYAVTGLVISHTSTISVTRKSPTGLKRGITYALYETTRVTPKVFHKRVDKQDEGFDINTDHNALDDLPKMLTAVWISVLLVLHALGPIGVTLVHADCGESMISCGTYCHEATTNGRKYLLHRRFLLSV